MIALRTVVFYIALITVIRLMGKRQVAQMEPSEFVVTMLVANLATIPLEELEIPVSTGLIAMGTVLVLELLVSWGSLKSIGLRRLLCGKPVILIDNGKLLAENLRRSRVTLDELSCHLREQGILEIQTVQFAILETNGTITVFPYPHLQPPTAADTGIRVDEQELPYTVISDGKLMSQNLKLAGKDRAWLDGYLLSRGCTISSVLLMTLTPGGKTHIIRRQPPPIEGEP